MRKKKNLIPRMEKASAVLAGDPTSLRGRWLEEYPGYKELHIELGCGKGAFTAGMAAEHSDILFAAMERVPDAMVVAMEKAVQSGLENVCFIDADAAHAGEIFADGEAERIYINFCDPWPGKKRAKRRLTAPAFLSIYAAILKKDGEIWFKTDNTDLFEWSLATFKECGWTCSDITRDLHADGPCGIMTDYEMKFYSEGKPICRCTAKKAGERN